jgi:hypothetical protein
VTFWRSHALSVSTRTSYASHLRRYLQFCNDYGLTAVPASYSIICRFAAYLGRSLSFTSVRQYLNIIRWIHLEAVLPNPLASNHQVDTLLAGMRRVKGSGSFKLPLSPAHIQGIRGCLRLSSIKDAQFFAVITTCFFGLLRIGNVLPSPPLGSTNVLRVRDLRVCDKGMYLQVRSSKTIQFRERVHTVVLPYFPNHPLCPVTALKNFLSLTGRRRPDESLFDVALAPLSASAFRSRLARVLALLNLSSADYSTHSLRRGGATWLCTAGVPLHVIKVLGDWHSDCVFRYLRPACEDRLQMLSSLPPP